MSSSLLLLLGEGAVAEAPDPPATHTLQIDQAGDDTWDAVGDDITARALFSRGAGGIATTRGRDVADPLMPPRSGSLSVSLDNVDGTYDIGGTDLRRMPVRWRAVFGTSTYDLWRGTMEQPWLDMEIGRELVRVSALGPLSLLANRSGYSTALYEGITTDVAIGHLLDAIGWPAGKRVLDTGTRTLQHWWLSADENAYQALLSLVVTEGPHASLYEDGAGNIVFEANDYRSSESRSVNIQDTYRGHTTEPVYSRLSKYDPGIDAVINRIALHQETREVEPTVATFRGLSDGTILSLAIRAELPSGAEVGDVLIAAIASESTNIAGMTAPSGWTLEGVTQADNVRQLHVYSKRVTEDEPAFYVWTWSSGPTAARIAILAYKDVSPGPPVEAFDIALDLNDADPELPSITTLGANRRIVAIKLPPSLNNEGVNASRPTGVSSTTRYEVVATADNPEMMVVDWVQEAAGATGSLVWDNDEADATQDTVLAILALPGDVATVWEAREDLIVAADETREIVARAEGPFKNAITPTENIEFTVASGSVTNVSLDRTSGTSVTISITAGGGGAAIQGPIGFEERGLTLRADPLTVTTRNDIIDDDAISQTAYGLRGLSPNIRRELTVADMESLAEDYIAALKDPRPVATFEVLGDRASATLTGVLAREVSDRVRLIEARGNIDFEGWVEEIRLRTFGEAGAIVGTLTIRGVVA